MESHAIRSYLKGLNCVRYLAFKVWGYFIIHAVIIELVASDAPLVTISNSSLTLRDGETLQLRCDVEYRTNGNFRWRHTPYNGRSNEDYSVESTVEIDRVTIFQHDDITPTSSLLLISNVSPDDSGTITCKYYYTSPSGTGSNIATNATSLCVSGKPDPPLCSSAELSQGTLNITCSTNTTALCPDDINLELRTNGDILEGNQTINVNSIERLASIPKDQLTYADHMCILRSNLFPDLIRNCSFDFEAIALPTLPTISATSDTTTVTLLSPTVTGLSNIVTDSPSPTRADEAISNRIMNSTATGSSVSSEPSDNKPVTFSLTAVIIAASAAAGGVLFLAMLLCLVIACCKRCCCRTPHEKSDNELADPRMEMRKKSSHSLPLPTLPTVMDEPSPTPNYFVIEQTLDQHEQNQRKVSMPVYATPDKSSEDAPEHLNTDGVKVPPSSSDSYTIGGNDLGQYASIYDIDDDRDKVSTPDPVSNNYDYASFNLTTSDPATLSINSPDVNGETEMAEEGFVENTIYNS